MVGVQGMLNDWKRWRSRAGPSEAGRQRTMIFTIRDLPRVMRRNGWTVGAQLMDRWFGRPARTMTDREKAGTDPSPDIETRLVTMRWALGFERVMQANNNLLATWDVRAREPGPNRVVAGRLRRWRADRPGTRGAFRFGDLSGPTNVVDRTSQINFERIETSLFTSIDDFYAGIGNAAIKLAVTGVAKPIANDRYELTVDEVGTYLRDTYEFIGDQRLGSWSPTGVDAMAFAAPMIPVVAEEAEDVLLVGSYRVNNTSFQEYRRHYGRGGDYVIFSNVVRRRLSIPITIVVPA